MRFVPLFPCWRLAVGCLYPVPWGGIAAVPGKLNLNALSCVEWRVAALGSASPFHPLAGGDSTLPVSDTVCSFGMFVLKYSKHTSFLF